MNRIRRTMLILALMPMILVGLPRLTPAVALDGSRAFTNGGGWIAPFGRHATFGVFAQIQKDGAFAGHVVYVDHSINFRLISTTIDSFVPGCTSTIHGYGDGNISPLDPVEFTVTVTDSEDNGDTFTIQAEGFGVPGGIYAASGTLQGGNIKAHGLSCP